MTSDDAQGLRPGRGPRLRRRLSSGNPQTFGEPAIFPGGISFGTVQFVDGTVRRRTARSRTIEVVNLLLGVGNDRLDVQGTLDPGRRREADRHDRDHDAGAPAPASRRSRRIASAGRAVRLEGAGLPGRHARHDHRLPGLRRHRLRRRRPRRHDRQHRHVPEARVPAHRDRHRVAHPRRRRRRRQGRRRRHADRHDHDHADRHRRRHRHAHRPAAGPTTASWSGSS